MSTAVARRLQEMAQQAEERRQRVSEIRRQSSLVVDAVSQLRLHRERRVWWGTSACAASVRTVPMETHHENDLIDPGVSHTSHDVLGQVQELLQEMDGLEREHWNGDDTLILICLQRALAAAARKGYSFGDVQAILCALGPSGMDG